jgi:hypothetical protein
MYPAALLCVFLRPEKGNSVMCQMWGGAVRGALFHRISH